MSIEKGSKLTGTGARSTADSWLSGLMVPFGLRLTAPMMDASR